MNWHIGQQVVCIDDKGTEGLEKDTIYTIQGLRVGCCSVQIDVGIKTPDKYGSGMFSTICRTCQSKRSNGTDNTSWYRESRFAPLMDISELTEILERKEEKV